MLMCGLAEVGIETVIADRQREVISPGPPVALLPGSAALDEPAARRTPKDAMRQFCGVVALKQLG